MLKKISHFPYFSNSVRTFFPLVALIAIFVPMWTVGNIVNQYPFNHAFFNIFEWHGFEMLFGFFYSLVIGFILTAGAHWTKQKPINGLPMLLLFAFWAIDQALILMASHPVMVFLSSLLLGIYFSSLVYLTLQSYPQRIKFFVLTGSLTILKLSFILIKIFNLNWLKEYIYDYTVITLCFLALLMASRVIPNFTRNILKEKYTRVCPAWLESSTLVVNLALFLVPLIQDPMFQFSVFISCGFLNLLKLSFYHFTLAIRSSIIGMLHIGFLTLSLSLVFKGLSFYIDTLANTRASLHLILTGGISILGLNIMIRATLGHTGRKVESSKAIKAMYFFIILGALIRFIVPVIAPDYFIRSLHHSMGHWTMAFLIYLIFFAHMCFKPRLDS